MSSNEANNRDSFPKTSWSLVGRAGCTSPAEAQAALNELVRRYLPKLRSYLITSRRMPADTADDLLQEFVVSKVLEQGLVARAKADRGKFRTFLLTSLRNFVYDDARAARAKKRSAVSGASGVDESFDPPDTRVKGPSEAFDEAWARGDPSGDDLNASTMPCRQPVELVEGF